MYIGYLKYGEPSFTHADTALPLLPTLQENNSYTWNWESLFDTVLEINLPLERLCFVGAVTLTLSKRQRCLQTVPLLAYMPPKRESSREATSPLPLAYKPPH